MSDTKETGNKTRAFPSREAIEQELARVKRVRRTRIMALGIAGIASIAVLIAAVAIVPLINRGGAAPTETGEIDISDTGSRTAEEIATGESAFDTQDTQIDPQQPGQEEPSDETKQHNSGTAGNDIDKTDNTENIDNTENTPHSPADASGGNDAGEALEAVWIEADSILTEAESQATELLAQSGEGAQDEVNRILEDAAIRAEELIRSSLGETPVADEQAEDASQ